MGLMDFDFEETWMGYCFYCMLAILKMTWEYNIRQSRVWVCCHSPRLKAELAGAYAASSCPGKPRECKCHTGKKPNAFIIIATLSSPYLSSQVGGESAFSGLLPACLYHFNTPDTPGTLHQQVHSRLFGFSVSCLDDAAVCFLLINDDALTEKLINNTLIAHYITYNVR